MSEVNDMAFFERMLAEHPEMANWTVNDLDAEICRLRAKIEDEERIRTQIYRENGFIAPYDGELFLRVLRPLDHKLTVSEMFEVIRRKKRRGHLQQEALEVFDRYYASEIRFPGDADVERLEAIYDSKLAQKDK